MKLQYDRYTHSVGKSLWHMQWCTKYRYKMFSQARYKSLAEASVRKQAYRHGMKIINIKVMPEHIHMLVQLPKGMTDSRAIQLLKGGSARTIFKHQPKFRLRYPGGHIWSRGYFSTTIGFSDADTISDYIKNQECVHLHPGQTTLAA